MEKINIDHSMKNVPIPPENEYKKVLVIKIEHFLRRFRWRMFHILDSLSKAEELQDAGNDDTSMHEESYIEEPKSNFGFKCEYKPPTVPELEEFEQDVLKIPKMLKFRKVKQTDLQNDLRKFMHELKKTKDVVVHADKSRNLYRMNKDRFAKVLVENITKDYKKAKVGTMHEVNSRTAEIAKDLKLEKRMEVYTASESYFLVKDHKENFPSVLSVRLINPCKTDLGKVSKRILQDLNTDLNLKIKQNQWRSTQSVLDWFEGIMHKKSKTFIKFDIVSFYPSISMSLLERTFEFARDQEVFISQQDVNIIMHARKSFLYNNGEPWVKKGDVNFDVPMGSYDGAEICELVGLYLLHKISSANLFEKNAFGLYRDDGLAVTKLNRQDGAKLCRELTNLFKKEGLGITCEHAGKVTDFLDVKLDLEKSAFRPFRKKADDVPLYIHACSNHPPTVIRQLPKMIQSRVSSISSTKEAFNDEAPVYEAALHRSGFKDAKLSYTPPERWKKKQRKRKVVYFNPPWNAALETNIGEYFLGLLDKHFPKKHPLHKYINRNCVKVSYSCTRSIKTYIAAHNRKVMQEKLNEDTNIDKKCNCRKGESRLKTLNKAIGKPLDTPPPGWFSLRCPVDGACMNESVIYSATVSTNSTSKEYIGLSSNSFKQRYTKHTDSFRWRERGQTTLSSYIWKLEDKNADYKLDWKIKSKATAYRPGAGFCDLCISEKTAILLADPKRSLNKRSEILEMCRHRARYKLGNLKQEKK